jgi:hypothetical protein
MLNLFSGPQLLPDSKSLSSRGPRPRKDNNNQEVCKKHSLIDMVTSFVGNASRPQHKFDTPIETSRRHTCICLCCINRLRLEHIWQKVDFICSAGFLPASQPHGAHVESMDCHLCAWCVKLQITNKYPHHVNLVLVILLIPV